MLSFLIKRVDELKANENKFFSDLDAELWNFNEIESYSLLKKPFYGNLAGGSEFFQKHFFWYMGSITTPPCAEHTFRFVMKVPVSVRASQFDVLKEKAYTHEDEPLGNSRNGFPMLNRMVYYHVDTSIDCKPQEIEKEIEKIKEEEEEIKRPKGQFLKAETKFHTYGITYNENLPNIDLGNGLTLDYVEKDLVPYGVRAKLESEITPVRETIIKSKLTKYQLDKNSLERGSLTAGPKKDIID